MVRLVADCAPESVAVIPEQEADRRDAAPLEVAVGLARREAEVLFRVSSRKISSEAASILALSRRTIDEQLDSIFQNLGVETRTAASALACKILHRLPISAARRSEHR